MNRPLPDNGIPVKQGDLSFIYKGVYHPIVWYGEEPYRPRVETLVIKDGRYVFLNMYDTKTAINNERFGNYELPGGSIDNDCDKITQAENEVNEEILVKVKNIYNTGIQYYETFSDGNVEEFKKESPLSYRGFMSEVFAAEYAGKFDAKNVEDKDLDPEMQKGKFYAISLVADKLTEYHIAALLNCPFVHEQSKMALQLYVRARGVTIESVKPVQETNKTVLNDKGEIVPEVCPKCGSKVAVFIKGEPVYLCTNKDCEAFFGVVPVNETKRSELPDDVFGIPEERKYPLDTEEHVRSAIKLFNHVDDKYEAELAENIIKQMKKYKIDDITIGEKNRLSKYIVNESLKPIMEAPGDDDDELTDYTTDADGDPDDTGDELTDYTDDIGEDTDDDTDDELTDYTEDDTEDNSDEPEEDPESVEEPSDEDPIDDEDELTDYTDDIEDDMSSDDSESDMGEDEDQNNNSVENSIVKNYNLILDFQTLFRYLEEICGSLESTVFRTPIQNSALTQIVNNMRKIRNNVANYIEFNFGTDYVTNLYNYNIFVKALKLNLEMLRLTKDLHTEDSTNN